MVMLLTEYSITNRSPSAGIGRQCELKIRWFNIVNVQVVFRIKFLIMIFLKKKKARYIVKQ